MILAHQISRAFGRFAACRFRFGLQGVINSAYVRLFGLDMSEFRKPSSYDSLLALFTRKLEVPRAIDAKNNAFISPSDGKVLFAGVGDGDMAMSVKGHTYSARELVGGELPGEFSYANIYLSPKDYHHYHAPCDLRLLSASYIPGALYSVSEHTLSRKPELYALNERVVLRCESASGAWVYLVFVGAINVAKMRFSFDKTIQTNAKSGAPSEHKYKCLYVRKGEDLGCFELGSTVVVLADSTSVRFDEISGKSVKFGERIGEIK